ncbi:MAG TPA: sugar ABC transporter permease [Methylomirabilota bacterium]|jgi:multiple sugar transport system permease protein|nr:sugar ABC transporter permease [Methylomirabilota bacterium]
MFFPAGALLLVLNFAPALYAVYLSVLDFNYANLARRTDFVGMRHYVEVLTDPHFWTAAQHSAVWALGVVPGSFVGGLYFALLLNEETRARGVLRTVLLLPWVTPLVVVAILWSFILSPGVGLVNDVLVHLGRIDLKYENWLGEPDLALPIVMGVQVWRWTPFFAITLLAALQAIPKDVYEAAEIDGAGTVSRFFHVTLPLLSPVIMVTLLQSLIWSIHNFSLVYIMTGGGPVYSSEVLTTYLWRTAFPNGQIGQAAAAGGLMMIGLCAIGSLWVLKLLRRTVA